MIKLCDLPENLQEKLVNDISDILQYRYQITEDSINEFWGTVQIGIEARKRA
jgi:hypothetical protein